MRSRPDTLTVARAFGRRFGSWRPGRVAAVVLLIFSPAIPQAVRAQDTDTSAGGGREFETAARFLATYCVSCHGESAPEGGLNLATADGWLRGGDTGVLIDDRQSGEGLLWDRVESAEMPPEGTDPRPSARDIEGLRGWLASGAPWPKDRTVSELDVTSEHRAGRDWWSLQPLRAAPFPEPPSAWARRPIDAWIEAIRETRGLNASPAANRRTILRRLAFDLWGLPPSEDGMRAFVIDERPDAYERRVDRYLASPRYGERWARHWLDVARYGDSHGYERDFPRDHAWRYRDYVIQAVNRDQSFDEFARWQIAGDVLEPEDPQARSATGFLACGPYDVTGLDETPSPVLKRMARADELDDIVTATGTAFLGLTVHCARCHNHKFDPIAQQDYYAFAAVFAGVRRGNVSIEPTAERGTRQEALARLDRELDQVAARLRRLDRTVDLADIVGGGDGSGTGHRDFGLDPRNGRLTTERVPMLDDVQVNRPVRGVSRYVDTLLVPDGGATESGRIVAASDGTTIPVPDTSGTSWDHVRNGSVHSQAHTDANDVDFALEEHSMLGMHANKLITFDLRALHEAFTAASRPTDGSDTDVRQGLADEKSGGWEFRATLAYGGRETNTKADFFVYVDGAEAFTHRGLTRSTGGVPVAIDLAPGSRFLTLVATDGGDGLGHDQVFLGDPRLRPLSNDDESAESDSQLRERLVDRRRVLQKQLEEVRPERMMFGVRAVEPQPMYVHLRGNPETPGEEVSPDFLSCMPRRPPAGGPATDEGERRRRLAEVMTATDSGLFWRVAANRVWHHHFGRGIVATPSDFGFYGDRPSHPRLLEHLAATLIRDRGSIKSLTRRIVTSASFRQSSAWNDRQAAIDVDNRWLWRGPSRRLEAEAVRDHVLAVSGNLVTQTGGPPFREFELQERYAPIYRYVSRDEPAYWRRSIYRFSVRSVPDPFLDVLDCPNPSTSTSVRNRTTTALQALALLNDDFMLDQARHFAGRLRREVGDDPASQATRAFELAYGRPATREEVESATEVVRQHGAEAMCRALFNTSEFLYVD